MSSLTLKEAAAAAAMITEVRRRSCMVAGVRRHVGQQQAGIVFILRHTPHLSPHQPLISTVQPGGDHLYQYCNYKETLVASAGVDRDTAGCGEGHFPLSENVC